MSRQDEQDLAHVIQGGISIELAGRTTYRQVSLTGQARGARDFFFDNKHALVPPVAEYFEIDETVIDRDDMLQAGRIGLTNAIHGFMPNQGIFRLLGVVGIFREMYSQFVMQGHAGVRLSREGREAKAEYEHVADDLFSELMREPTADEIAAQTKDPGAVLALAHHFSEVVSLDQLLEEAGGDPVLDELLVSSVDVAEEALVVPYLAELMDALAANTQLHDIERAKRILYAHVGYDLNSQDVGAQVGLSDGRVRSLVHQVLIDLRSLAREQ